MINDIAHKKYLEKDYSSAYSLALKAAQSGSSPHMTFIGELYLRGEGVPQSYSEAERWLMLGAESGDERSLFSLARFYETNKEYEQAMKIYSQPTLKKFGPALYRTGHLVRAGFSHDENLDELAIFELAAEQGHLFSKTEVARLQMRKEGNMFLRIVKGIKYIVTAIKTFVIALFYKEDDRVLY